MNGLAIHEGPAEQNPPTRYPCTLCWGRVLLLKQTTEISWGPYSNLSTAGTVPQLGLSLWPRPLSNYAISRWSQVVYLDKSSAHVTLIPWAEFRDPLAKDLYHGELYPRDLVKVHASRKSCDAPEG